MPSGSRTALAGAGIQGLMQGLCIYILKLNTQTTAVYFSIWARIRLPAPKYKKA